MLSILYVLCAEGKNRTLAQAEGGCLREARLAGFGSWGSKTSVFRGVFGMETEKPLVPRRLTSGLRVFVRRGADATRTYLQIYCHILRKILVPMTFLFSFSEKLLITSELTYQNINLFE